MPKIKTPEFTPFTVRLSYLKRKHACNMQRNEFESRFGKSLRVTKDKLPELYRDFDVRWFVDVAMPATKLDAAYNHYVALYRAAWNRSYETYRREVKKRKMLDKYGFVRTLSAKRQAEYDKIFDARRAAETRARHRLFTRCLSHLGGKEFR